MENRSAADGTGSPAFSSIRGEAVTGEARAGRSRCSMLACPKSQADEDAGRPDATSRTAKENDQEVTNKKKRKVRTNNLTQADERDGSQLAGAVARWAGKLISWREVARVRVTADTHSFDWFVGH